MALSIGRAGRPGTFLKKKAKRLLIPFLSVTIFLSIPLKYCSGYWDNSTHIWSDIFLGQFLLMGNSHLWFVVSLFIISVVFYFVHQLKWDKGIIYWPLVIIISILGKQMAYTFNFFGMAGAMKNYLFFNLGFYLFEKIRKFEISFIKTALSWIGMIALFMSQRFFSFNIPYLNIFIYYMTALWGCFNMVALCKLLQKIPLIANSPIFRSLNKNSYDLYLYSDPFNYVMIFIFSIWMGYGYITSTLGSIIAYLCRIIFSIVLAYGVIWLISTTSRISKTISKKI